MCGFEKRRFARFFSGISVAFLGLTGCAGYHLGPSNGLTAGEQSVQIRPFPNQTDEPSLSAALSHSLRRKLQEDGTFHLETQERPDIILAGKITRFDRGALTFQQNDILTTRDFSLTLTAHVTAVDRLTGHLLWERDFTGKTSMRVAGADQASAERQALPLLTDDLARKIVEQLADGTW